MTYMTVREAAEKWKISPRRVQQYCLENRITGAKKLGSSWLIPKETLKPADPRQGKGQLNETVLLVNPFDVDSMMMPLMNTPFLPGNCLDAVNIITSESQKNIVWAEYYYFTGQAEMAIQIAGDYLTSSNIEERLSACWIYGYANLTTGQIQQARRALKTVNALLADTTKVAPELRAELAFVAFAIAVLLHLPVSERLPAIQDFAPLLPPGLRAFALYVQAHYLYLQGHYEKSCGIIEAALTMGGSNYPISAIYLHLAAVMNYMSLKQVDVAEQHLRDAWALAQPDDLIEAFGEHHGLLGGMLELVFKKDWPDDFRRIINITYRFSWGWRQIHNPITDSSVADNLSTTEFAIAMLAARGWTNQEIAEHMNISLNTVKQYLSIIKEKLGITKRQELKKYMLL